MTTKRHEVDAWLSSLLHESEVERARACTKLGELGRHACGAVGALVRLVELDDEACVRRAATSALIAIARDGVRVDKALACLLVHDTAMRAWLLEQVHARGLAKSA